jgi:DNA-binding transcriptional LysR family regulator
LVTESATQNPVEDGCDVIVANRKPAGPGLVGREIGAVQHVICASPDYFRRHGRPNRPADLCRHNCLVSSPFAPKEWWFTDGAREAAVEVRGRFCSNSAAVLARVALDGLGIVRVPRYAVRAELVDGRLESIFDDIVCSRERMRAYYSRTKYLPAKTTAFIEFLQSELTPDRT